MLSLVFKSLNFICIGCDFGKWVPSGIFGIVSMFHFRLQHWENILHSIYFNYSLRVSVVLIWAIPGYLDILRFVAYAHFVHFDLVLLFWEVSLTCIYQYQPCCLCGVLLTVPNLFGICLLQCLYLHCLLNCYFSVLSIWLCKYSLLLPRSSTTYQNLAMD